MMKIGVFFILLLWLTRVSSQGYQDINFTLERPGTLPSITQLEVMCGKDHMTVQIAFSRVFQGMVFSKGQYGHPNCIYVKPFSGGTHFEFKIYYNKCGTKPDLGGRFYENTIIVQYDADLIEVWDEAKRLRCEWYNDYEKTASKPPMVIADLEVVELNFRGDNVDCWMEIQDGKGPWASPVTGIVPLGSTLTMVIAINDKAGQFDMRVKSCQASDGVNAPIYLSDEHGCVLRPKMISKFMKLRNNDGRATVISYAYFHAFKFPDSMSVHLRCKVEICRYGCPDHCQRPVPGNSIGNEYGTFASSSERQGIHKLSAQGLLKRQAETKSRALPRKSDEGRTISETPDSDVDADGASDLEAQQSQPTVVADKASANQYLSLGISNKEAIELPMDSDFPWGPRSLKRKRSIGRYRRETDVGVNTEYQVISEADIEFTLSQGEGVTVFKGKREDIIYGICLPAPGFSALFVLLAMCTVISVLVAGFMCHHRQLQKDTTESPAIPHTHSHFMPINMIHYLRAHLSR